MKTNHSPLTAAFLHHQSELRQHLLRRVGCSDTADDLLQDTFLRIAQLESGCEIVNPRAFLYRVAGNLALDHLRWQARRQVWDVGPPDEEWPCPCPQPDRLLQGRQQWRAVHHQLTDLPPASRQMLYAYRLDGKSQRQIAAELRVSERHVEHVLRRTEQLLAGVRPDNG